MFNSGSHSTTSAGYILGFSAVDYVSATTQTTANVPNLNVFNYLQISVNGYNSCLTTNNGFDTFVISVNVNAGNIIIYNQLVNWKQTIPIAAPFNSLYVRLVINNVVQSIQNADWTLVLRVS